MSRGEVEHRQVLVVGAGPGGSATAQRLAEQGLDVLVLERRQVVGNPANCGECVPLWGEMHDTYPKIRDDEWLQDYFQFPHWVIAKNLNWMRLYGPSMRAYGFELQCISVHRLQYDGHLADRAINAGAEVRTGIELRNVKAQPKLGRDLYVTNEGRFSADYVIDATGSLAHVARLRGQGSRPGVQLPTVFCQASGEMPDSFDIFIGSVAPGGYAWIIPKGDDIANVGLGVHHRHIDGSLKDRLDEFCQGLGYEVLSWGGGWIPLGGMVKTAVHDNVLAVGDAAGLVMPSNGGGIGQAIVSGKMAADAVVAHLKDGTPLAAYDATMRGAMGKQLAISTRTKNLFWTFCRNDWMTSAAMRFLGVNGLRRAVDCRRPFYLI
uniref:Geranylgeranyl reductase n=1 Tax=uncultured marine group II/III euryarchaeote KM3_203_B10 TaxID=1457981 RepID=A0A075GZ23_9EURY|nr:geranylgeranyl reductase [uncultured marine group II/III euryarchaeote KM3_203_B10]